MGFGPDDVESLCRELNVRRTLQLLCPTLLPTIQLRVASTPHSKYMAGVLCRVTRAVRSSELWLCQTAPCLLSRFDNLMCEKNWVSVTGISSQKC